MSDTGRLLILLVVLAATIWLQVYLSKKNQPWPGLILPILSLLLSIFLILFMVVPEGENHSAGLLSIALTFLAANIPTLVLLASYFGVRTRRSIKKQLNQMKSQDLG